MGKGGKMKTLIGPDRSLHSSLEGKGEKESERTKERKEKEERNGKGKEGGKKDEEEGYKKNRKV